MKECLLDTDIVSYYLKGNEIVQKKVEEYLYTGEFVRLTISEITYFEILAGLEYRKASKQIRIFESFANKCNIARLSIAAIRISAQAYGKLRQKGIIIGTPDLLIAGIAIENGYVLVTNNEKHFQAIDSLIIANWTV
jgi:tRNA(fMet)-specific endonuclease VapC